MSHTTPHEKFSEFRYQSLSLDQVQASQNKTILNVKKAKLSKEQ
jgi:hypothetical protein